MPSPRHGNPNLPIFPGIGRTASGIPGNSPAIQGFSGTRRDGYTPANSGYREALAVSATSAATTGTAEDTLPAELP